VGKTFENKKRLNCFQPLFNLKVNCAQPTHTKHLKMQKRFPLVSYNIPPNQ